MPRKRRQKPEDIQAITQATGLTTAADLPVTEDPLPHRPTGPRPRAINEPGAIYTGPNARLEMDADTFLVTSPAPIPTKHQDALVAIGMDDVSPDQDGTAFLGPKSQQAKARIQQIVAEIDGKPARMARGR